MTPAARFRGAALEAGYTRDESLAASRAYGNPRCDNLRVQEGRTLRYTAVAFRDDARRTVFVLGTTS